MEEIKYPEQLKFYELTGQLELINYIIKKIEFQLEKSLDLQYLTAESTLKIMKNNFLLMKNQILISKHEIMKALDEIIKKEKN